MTTPIAATVDGWSGQVQCEIASRGVGYEDDQTHTWMLSGAPGVRNDFRDYPATWTVSGSGRRTPVAGRLSAPGAGESWAYAGSSPSASITFWVPVGTGTIRIAGGQRAVTATNGLKGTTGTAPFTGNVAEWRFQYIDVVGGAARTSLSDSRTQSRSDLAGWRPPPGTTVTETCSWKLTKSASSSDVETNAKGATGGAAGAAATGAASAAGRAAATAGSVGAAARSGASGSAAGATNTGGVAGAASAGAPSPTTATTKPGGGSAAPGAAAAAAGGASPNSATAGNSTAGNSSSGLSPDVMRPYTAVGRTPAPGTGVVVATLVDDTGAPLVGVSIADIRLVDATSLPVGAGPYMFGAAGDIVDSNTLRASASFNGRSRVAFLDVPAGTLTLTVMYSRDGKVVTRSAKVITKAGAITAVQP